MEVFDKDGNPITEGIFTQADLDAKIEEFKTTYKPEVKEEKKESTDEVPQYIKDLQEQVASLSKNFETTGVNKFTTTLDADKRNVFNSQFEALSKTGTYDNTPEGIEKRASDAYMLTTGQPFDAGAFNMQNLGAFGGKANIVQKNERSEEDKKIGADIFGLKEDDYKKYGESK